MVARTPGQIPGQRARHWRRTFAGARRAFHPARRYGRQRHGRNHARPGGFPLDHDVWRMRGPIRRVQRAVCGRTLRARRGTKALFRRCFGIGHGGFHRGQPAFCRPGGRGPGFRFGNRKRYAAEPSLAHAAAGRFFWAALARCTTAALR